MSAQAEAYEDELAVLRAEVATATLAARVAYRDTARLIRLLTVISEPSTVPALVDRTLEALSEVFAAAVTCVVRLTWGQVQLLAACGLGEDDQVGEGDWPLLPAQAAVLLSGDPGCASVGEGLDPNLLPSVIAGCNPQSMAWALMGGRGQDQTLLLLFRMDAEPFGEGDLQTLGSVARRLHESVQAGEQRDALERLARLGQRLAHHLDLAPLLGEAADLLRQITQADGALVTLVEDGTATLRAGSGLSDADVAAWPARPAEAAAWQAGERGEGYTGSAGSDAVLSLPIVRDGVPVAMLYLTRAGRLAFPSHVAEAATIFGGYVGAAVVNAQLYRSLARSESRLRLITDAISDMVSVVDEDGICRYASPSFERGLSLKPDAIVGHRIADFVHPDHQQRYTAMLGRAELAPVEQLLVRTGDDAWAWVETACRLSPSGGNAVVLSSRLIGQRKELEAELLRRATHDPLTGLANRDLARQHLDLALAPDAQGPVGLLFLDLDHFKSVNDRLGHEAGDELLQQVTRRLQRCVRGRDLLARLGGDEFVMVVHDVRDLQDVTRVGARVLHELRAPFLLGGEQVSISCSVGGVIGEPGRTGPDALLRDADAAMYDAKDRGRGRLALFNDAAGPEAVGRLALRSELPTALERGELTLHYQPIVALDSGSIVGFEALLRWMHPLHGAISPDVFVPLAEETKAIIAIGRWVLDEAAQQLARWQRLSAGPDLWMSVHLSEVQLRHPHLVAEVDHAATTADLQPTQLWLEVTENSGIEAAGWERLRQLRAAGFGIALDDFGTFQSNFDRLRQFPVNHLKIDRSFITGLPDNKIDQGVVRAIMVIGEALTLDVVAEGVETEDQRAELLRAGCKLGQGFLFSRPMAADAVSALLAGSGPPAYAR